MISSLERDGGDERELFCDSNCIFTFLVLIYGLLLLFSLRNNIHDFSYLEMFSYGKVAVTVNS